MKVDGKAVTARRVAWELVHGALPVSARVNVCPADPSCVRVEHLSVKELHQAVPEQRTRARKGTGSMRRLRLGTWELRVTAGRWGDGRVRTLYRTVKADNEADATAQLVAFVDQIARTQQPEDRNLREITMDEAVEKFLIEYLRDDTGRAEKTISDYRKLHARPMGRVDGDRMWRASVVGVVVDVSCSSCSP